MTIKCEKTVLTNRLIDGKMSIFDNSHPGLAYPMQPTQNVVKTYSSLTVVFCYTFLHSELVASDMPDLDKNYRELAFFHP